MSEVAKPVEWFERWAKYERELSEHRFSRHTLGDGQVPDPREFKATVVTLSAEALMRHRADYALMCALLSEVVGEDAAKLSRDEAVRKVRERLSR